MSTSFLKGLAELSAALDAAALIGSDDQGTPYLVGMVEVRLEGETVGQFEFTGDEWVTYHPKEKI
jgi:hypothetical protein